ncbi:MAG: capsular biosynthesis protein [Kiritimatiellae bacterium]|nr:capsular biosynthesis protein [Kiritimatiellia bacterium]
MIDLHCHVLPGLDDGAKDDASALAMCRMAAADGIRILVATPHYRSGVGVEDLSVVAPAAERLQRLVDAEGIGLEIRHACEMPLLEDFLACYRSGTWLAYDSSRKYVLWEIPTLPCNGPAILSRIVSQLVSAGATPVLAHPERLPFLDDLRAVEDVCARGALLQVTAEAVVGDSSAGRRARAWLDAGLVAAVATDSHSVHRRPPRLSPVRDFLRRRYGEAAATALVSGNPSKILAGEPPA